MTAPLVSVVVSVYNGEPYLRSSLDSLLRQEDVPCEFIVVDDGSTDGSAAVLEEVARNDPRLRLLRQPNRGLTQALIRGCAEARGEFIARHDADDLSLSGRLRRQVQLLQAEPELSMVSCWSLAVGPNEETLFEVVRPEDWRLATKELQERDVGPAGHGSVMFRSAAYRKAGGYRPQFRVAQDWDLWLRLMEQGGIGYVPAVLYAFRVLEQSISGLRRDQQLRLLAVARKCRAARLAGESEQPLLDEACRISAEPRPAGGRTGIGNNYFIGKCLFQRRDRRALTYLSRCVRRQPWSWRHWAAFAGAALLCWRGAT